MPTILFNILTFFNIDYRKFNRVFPIVLILGLLYIFPTLVDDIPYLTDFERRVDGYSNISPFGTKLLSLLCFNLNLDLFNTDNIFFTGPLNKIISLILFCFCSTIFCLHFVSLKSKFQNALIAFSLIANPFLLHAFCFTTDCIIFITATSLSLLASLETSSKRFNLFFGTALIFIIYGLSYIHLSTFIAASFFIFFIQAKINIQSALVNLEYNAYKMLLGVISCQLFISTCGKGLIFTPLSFDNNLLVKVKENISLIVLNTFSPFSNCNILITSLALFIFIFCLKYIIESKNKIQAFFVCITCIIAILFSQIGIQIFSKYPLIDPKSFSAISILLVFSYYSFFKLIYRFTPLSKIIIIIITFHFFYFSYGLTAMLRNQYNFNHEVASSIINQLYRNGFKKNDSIIFEGFIGASPSVESTRSRDGSFKAFHLSDLGGSWLSTRFFQHLGLNAKYIEGSLEDNAHLSSLCKTKALVDTNIFQIFSNTDNLYLVAFRYGNCYQNKSST